LASRDELNFLALVFGAERGLLKLDRSVPLSPLMFSSNAGAQHIIVLEIPAETVCILRDIESDKLDFVRLSDQRL
jgi:hypothetical protein